MTGTVTQHKEIRAGATEDLASGDTGCGIKYHWDTKTREGAWAWHWRS